MRCLGAFDRGNSASLGLSPSWTFSSLSGKSESLLWFRFLFFNSWLFAVLCSSFRLSPHNSAGFLSFQRTTIVEGILSSFFWAFFSSRYKITTQYGRNLHKPTEMLPNEVGRGKKCIKPKWNGRVPRGEFIRSADCLFCVSYSGLLYSFGDLWGNFENVFPINVPSDVSTQTHSLNWKCCGKFSNRVNISPTLPEQNNATRDPWQAQRK